MTTQVKENQMVKVTTTYNKEYKGITLKVTKTGSIILLTDKFETFKIEVSEIEHVASTRFQKELSSMLREVYADYKESQKLEKEIKKQQAMVDNMRGDLYDVKSKMKDKMNSFQEKRFDLFGTLEDVANKLTHALGEAKVNHLSNSGRDKSVSIDKVYAKSNKVHLSLCFTSEFNGRENKLLGWNEYERNFSCWDSAAFLKKYCPNVLQDVKQAFYYGTVKEEQRTWGEIDDRGKVEVETNIAVSLNINKDNFEGVLKQIIQSIRSFKTSYILKNNSSYHSSYRGNSVFRHNLY